MRAKQKTQSQLKREVDQALKTRPMTVKRADAIIRDANLDGFSGRCGRVAIAINQILFGNKGRYVIATNPWINAHPAWKRGAKVKLFMGHVVVEWKGRLFDSTGVIDHEEGVESFGMIDHNPDYAYLADELTDDQQTDGQLHYVDDVYLSRASQERAIEEGTEGQCPLRDVERALRESMASK